MRSSKVLCSYRISSNFEAVAVLGEQKKPKGNELVQLALRAMNDADLSQLTQSVVSVAIAFSPQIF